MASGEGRRQGFTGRAPVDQVLAWIDAHVAPLRAERLPAAVAAGRVLARDVTAAADVPAIDRAGADGIAVRAEDTVGASAYNPIPLRWAPRGARLAGGYAIRVHAGAPLPEGADAVVSLERLAEDGEHGCAVIEPVPAGEGVVLRGKHIQCGTVIAAAGRLVRPVDVGLMSAAGVAEIAAVRRPRVSLLLVGRGVAEAGRALAPGDVYDADGPLLRALVERDGGIPAGPCVIAREVPAIRDALSPAEDDVIILAGGSGSGADDCAAIALAEAGELAFHGVALRPGETAGGGKTRAGVPVFLLPGNPADCLWAYEMLAGRAVRRLGARDPRLPFAARTMSAGRKIVSSIGMAEIYPVQFAGEGIVTPLASFADSGLAAAARADGFVLVPEDSEGYPQGASVTVYLYEPNGGLSASAGPVQELWTTSKPR
jgi:molybdopterin molybdotransferase